MLLKDAKISTAWVLGRYTAQNSCKSGLAAVEALCRGKLFITTSEAEAFRDEDGTDWFVEKDLVGNINFELRRDDLVYAPLFEEITDVGQLGTCSSCRSMFEQKQWRRLYDEMCGESRCALKESGIEIGKPDENLEPRITWKREGYVIPQAILDTNPSWLWVDQEVKPEEGRIVDLMDREADEGLMSVEEQASAERTESPGLE